MRTATLTLALGGALALAVPAFAEDSAPTNRPAGRITLEQLYEKKLGGRLKKPGTGIGTTAFVNVGAAIENAEIEKVVATIGRALKHEQKVLSLASLDGLPTREAVGRLGIAIGVFVVSDPKLPPMLVAPEDRWALVNVAKLKAGLKDDLAGQARHRSRCRGELQRAFLYVAGCGSSQHEGNLMGVSEVAQLDAINPDLTVMDAVMRSQKYLKNVGVTMPMFVSYKKACEQGWAPAPTNDVQKAIWDKVHQMPSEPLKIKPETKKLKD